MITASIVLYRNEMEKCRVALGCLLNSSVDQIYLVDHSGSDRLSVLKNYSVNIEYIPHPNTGFGGGHNLVLRKILKLNPDGYHLVMNPDISFESGSIAKLAAFMDAHPEAGLCSPRIVNPQGDLQYLCKLLPTPLDLFGKRFLPRHFRNRIDRLMLKHWQYDQVKNIPWLSGAFMFLRVSVLQKIGLYDERFFLYGEDIDLSRRLHAFSQTLYCPSVTVSHVHEAASYKSAKMCLIHMISLCRYFNKWGWLFDRERQSVNSRTLQDISCADSGYSYPSN